MDSRTAKTVAVDGMLPLFEVIPDGEANGAVIVLQEAFGVNDHIRDVARRVAVVGYHVVAPHLFHRQGDADLSYEDIPAVIPYMRALTVDGLKADLDATLLHLGTAGYAEHKVSVIGFCLGGTVAMLAGTWYRFAAAVTFYGGGVTESRFSLPALVDVASALQTPWLGLYADLDHSIRIDEVEALRDAVEAAAVEAEIVHYPDAGHGFHCDQRASYHPASAQDAWARALAWIDGRVRG